MTKDAYSAHRRFERKCVRPAPGRTLLCGSHLYEGREDRRTLFSDAVGVDLIPGPGVDVVADLEEDCSDLGQFNHVECVSVLEHSRRPWLLAGTIERLLAPGGTLHLSAPFVWRVHAYPDDYFRYTAAGIRTLFPGIEWLHLAYASQQLSKKPLLKPQTVDGHPHFPRCEVLGFGRRV